MKDYQEQAMGFRWDTCDNLAYSVFGMYEEMGEALEKTPIRYNGISGFFAHVIIYFLIVFGKLLGKWGKAIRGKKVGDKVVTNHYPPFELGSVGFERRISLMNEFGDIHWMLANYEDQVELSPDECEEANIRKLSLRKKRNEIASHKDH